MRYRRTRPGDIVEATLPTDDYAYIQHEVDGWPGMPIWRVLAGRYEEPLDEGALCGLAGIDEEYRVMHVGSDVTRRSGFRLVATAPVKDPEWPVRVRRANIMADGSIPSWHIMDTGRTGTKVGPELTLEQRRIPEWQAGPEALLLDLLDFFRDGDVPTNAARQLFERRGVSEVPPILHR